MRLMLENLQSGAVETDAARQNYLQLLGSECHRLSALIENVLDFARIEHNRKIYHMAEADVAAMIHDAVQLMQPHAAQRRQKLIADLETIEPAPQIDALALQQAVINLIDNAMKFSPADTKITISARRRDEKTWQLSVADEGPGIPESEHERIFERFYRIGNELRRETQGAGIGLAIVKHTVEAHGGRIEVDSQPGRGATFVLILPYTQEPD
jgi:signal transduction histidine kinase